MKEQVLNANFPDSLAPAHNRYPKQTKDPGTFGIWRYTETITF